MEARAGAITHETLPLTAVDFHRFKVSVSGVILSSQGDAQISSAVRLVTNSRLPYEAIAAARLLYLPFLSEPFTETQALVHFVQLSLQSWCVCVYVCVVCVCMCVWCVCVCVCCVLSLSLTVIKIMLWNLTQYVALFCVCACMWLFLCCVSVCMYECRVSLSRSSSFFLCASFFCLLWTCDSGAPMYRRPEYKLVAFFTTIYTWILLSSLNRHLAQFVVEIRKTNGELYSPASLHQLLCGFSSDTIVGKMFTTAT